MDFNEDQKKAVMHEKGPILLLAGPGTGKTAVIVGHLCHMLEKGVDPSGILVITFTRAAALEMKTRFERESGSVGAVTFGTFHSVFYHILRESGSYREDCILKDSDKKMILKDIIEERVRIKGCSEIAGDEAEGIRVILEEISFVKANRLFPGPLPDRKDFESKIVGREIFREIFLRYEEIRKQEQRLDFDDMINETLELFKQKPEVLARWQRTYRWLLIDEFQDVNKSQYEAACLLAQPERNLFAVGDDDQSIYGFRGSDPSIMLSFRKDFPDAIVTALRVNYRSLPSVTGPADRLIRKNRSRYAKEIRNARQGKGVFSAVCYPDMKIQMEQLCGKILEYRKKGAPFRNIAVLYRSEAVLQAVLPALQAAGIPYESRVRLPFFYDQWIMKDVMSYLRLAVDEGSRGDLIRILNHPNRWIGRVSYETEAARLDRRKPGNVLWREELQEIRRFYSRRPQVQARLDLLKRDLERMGHMPPEAAMTYLYLAMDYRQYIRKYAMEKGIEEEKALSLWKAGLEAASGFAGIPKWLEAEREQREAFELREKEEEEREEDEDPLGRVHLMTMHGSKGLEYPVVFLPDLTEGLVPHGKNPDAAQLEEERRLFYVALTRAKDDLYLSCSVRRYDKRPEYSRFFSDMGVIPERYKG